MWVHAPFDPKFAAHERRRSEVATKVIQQDSVSAKLINRWEQVGQKPVALASEVPEDKFDYRPERAVRSFAGVLRHVAFWNLYVADTARGMSPNDADNALSESEFRTKARIIDVLKRSVGDAAAALNNQKSGLSPETAEMLVTFIEHTCEHYGQLVVYARLNGILPPASRGTGLNPSN
jgi:uncharacterized damage-inducible protein DinB